MVHGSNSVEPPVLRYACCKMWSGVGGGGTSSLKVDKGSSRSMWAGVVVGRRQT